MVQPTTTGRQYALDILRGVAILGILIANLPAFSSPGVASQATAQILGEGTWVEAAIGALVSGKFRSMLAILFGVGIYLQFCKRSSVEGNWPGGYLKRTFWLAILGLAHGLLIWWGDILFTYSAVAFGACLCVELNPKTVKIIVGGICGLGGLLTVALVALLLANPKLLAESGSVVTVAEEMRTFAQGSYLDQVALRVRTFPALAPMVLIGLYPFLFALFLVGISLAKSGVLAAPSAHPIERNRCLWVGLGLGLPLNLLTFTQIGRPGMEAFHLLNELIAGPLLALGYVMLVAMWAERGMGRPGGWLADTGRMALSVYILQSVLCTAFFYSWGLGWFGRATLAMELGVLVGVWVVCVGFARMWLARFRLGPVEWLWRSLTESKRLEIRPSA